MTRDQAQKLIALHKQGMPVKALDLQEAIDRVATKRQRYCRLPQLSPAERQRVNGVLLYRLGLELGRIEARKAA